jgi:hypothetical protein
MKTARAAAVRVMGVAALVVLAGRTTGPRTSVQAAEDALEQGFKTPPDAAKPRAWWHWLNGNVTKEGITADFEWMKRTGIAGMQMFDGSLGVPQFTEERLVWMTPKWKEAFRHAGAEADRLGLEMSMAASGGWSETAGPWVKPEQAMKKLVWSETRVQGPKKFAGVLTAPPSINSHFQNMPIPPAFDFPMPTDLPGAKPPVKEPPQPPDPTHYADVAVLAYRVPDDEVRMPDAQPKLTTSGGELPLAGLTDGDYSKTFALPLPEGGKPAWVRFDFAQPFRAQAFSIAMAPGAGFFGATPPRGQLQSSADGTTWTTLATLPGPEPPFGGFPIRTYAFPETAAKSYRVLMEAPEPNPILLSFGMPPVKQLDIAELEIHSSPRVAEWEDKASFATVLDAGLPTPAVAASQAITRANVVDLTSKMGKDGKLDWDAPAGRWVVLRLGYSLTGEKNHPATPEATGYEVDKLSKKHVNAYVETYVNMVADAIGPYFGKSFRYFLMDSWEAGHGNWTDDMLSEFRTRRDYDPAPYLPVLTGRVVESADASERFLWDFRRTIADLLAENHYKAATDYFHKRGVGLYAEAMGTGLPTTGDGLLNKGQVDIPMGEFWVPFDPRGDSPEHRADAREAASAAHIYGKTIAATESFTSMPMVPGWAQSPAMLKPIGDRFFAMGVNRIVFHTSDHQPFVDDAHKPGITLGPFGQHYTRNITWAEQAVAWNTYLARVSHMLQQGLFVGDLAYYYGDGAPISVPSWKRVRPEPPAGYNYDYVNTDVLLNRMSVKDGRLVLPDGMSYRVLVVPEDVDRLTLPVARKIRDLVSAGAVVLAPRPGLSPSLSGAPAADEEIRAIANDVWGSVDGRSVTEHAYGKGKVYWGLPVADVLGAEKVKPDFEHTRPRVDSQLVWIHRRTPDTDLYFVASQNPRADHFTASFRVEGKEAELWHPDTGTIEPAAYSIADGRTTVPFHLDPNGSVFVVFRKPAAPGGRTLPHPVSTALATVSGPWTLSFPANWGAPAQVKLDTLASWTANPDAGVKYFSGTAVYAKDVQAPATWFKPGATILLDLGAVKELAEVSVNGKPVGGILWKPPFQADVTSALKPGANHVEIKVTNLWPNRMIGDLQPGNAKRYTFTDYKAYTKDSPLLESGLLGPVTVSSVTRP